MGSISNQKEVVMRKVVVVIVVVLIGLLIWRCDRNNVVRMEGGVILKKEGVIIEYNATYDEAIAILNKWQGMKG